MTRMRPLCLIALLAAGVLAGCGGGGTPPSPPGSPDNPLPATQPDAEAGTPATGGRTNEAQPASGHKRAEQPGYRSLVEKQTAKPRTRFTPCNLVSQAQARAIVGEPVQVPLEAPQGPTCLYRTQGGDRMVTLAVQSIAFDKLRRQVRRPQRLNISDRPALCGKRGQSVLYVSLTGRRVLSIAAPCDVARRFASAALPRVGGA